MFDRVVNTDLPGKKAYYLPPFTRFMGVGEHAGGVRLILEMSIDYY